MKSQIPRNTRFLWLDSCHWQPRSQHCFSAVHSLGCLWPRPIRLSASALSGVGRVPFSLFPWQKGKAKLCSSAQQYPCAQSLRAQMGSQSSYCSVAGFSVPHPVTRMRVGGTDKHPKCSTPPSPCWMGEGLVHPQLFQATLLAFLSLCTSCFGSTCPDIVSFKQQRDCLLLHTDRAELVSAFCSIRTLPESVGRGAGSGPPGYRSRYIKSVAYKTGSVGTYKYRMPFHTTEIGEFVACPQKGLCKTPLICSFQILGPLRPAGYQSFPGGRVGTEPWVL